MSTRGRRKAGLSLLRCAPIRLMSARVGEERVSERILRERAGYLIEMVSTLAEESLAVHWNQVDLDRYLQDGQPTFAYKAAGQTFSWPDLRTPDRYAPSRVGYMALEAMGRTLRSSDFRRQILDALINDKPLPAKADAVSIRNLTRARENYTKLHGRSPRDFFELEPDQPKVARQALLAVCDEQFCELSQSELALMLPLVAAPKSKADWAWHTIPYRQPAHLEGSACKPTLRIAGKRLIADMPFEKNGVNLISLTPMRAIGFDWGVNTPLVGSLVWLEDGRPLTDGREVRFSADGLLDQVYDLCGHTQDLSVKIDLFSRFLGVPLETEPVDVRSDNPLVKDRQILWRERKRVSKRYSKLLDELAHLVSRWAVEQALAYGCDTIVLEDLKTLEPQLNRRQNLRVNLGLRGKIAELIGQKAQEVGIRVLVVNARGTSSCCSRCGQKTRHYTSPDSAVAGYRWMRCPACGVSLDRDHAGSERIAGRGLAPQALFVSRVITAKPIALDPLTLPARGPRAKQRRAQIEMPGASSLATPAPAESLNALPGHRPLEAAPQDPQSGLQAGSTSNLGLLRFRPPRNLDGLRSAYLGQLACSPLRAFSTA